jgi:regulator of replication initiation timing
MDATTLFDRVADPLNDIKNCLKAIRDITNDQDSIKDDNPLSKLETKRRRTRGQRHHLPCPVHDQERNRRHRCRPVLGAPQQATPLQH